MCDQEASCCHYQRTAGWGSLCLCLSLYPPLSDSLCVSRCVVLSLFLAAWLYFCVSSFCPWFYLPSPCLYAPLPGPHTTFSSLCWSSLRPQFLSQDLSVGARRCVRTTGEAGWAGLSGSLASFCWSESSRPSVRRFPEAAVSSRVCTQAHSS